jgi:small subunit ribosomal protein S7
MVWNVYYPEQIIDIKNLDTDNMSKKVKNIKKYTIKKVTLDPLYKSYWYSKFLNKLMLDGKKHAIEKTISQLFYKFKLKYRATPITLLFVSIIRLKPLIGIIPKRLGKLWKSVPYPLQPRRQLVIALKWLVSHIKLEKGYNLRTRVISTFASVFRRKSKNKRAKPNELLKKKKVHYFQVVTDRINTRFRWQ